MGISSRRTREARAVEAFRCAADTIGDVVPGLSVFAVTRGQFSMVDAVLHVIAACAPARISLWTWTVADYEIQAFRSLLTDGSVQEGRLIIDAGALKKNAALIHAWRAAYGDGSVRFVANHAKLATVEGHGLKVLLRGSMNLNHNPRFEQLDVTEGGPAFDLVRRIEDGLEVLDESAAYADVWRVSRVSDAWDTGALAVFREVKRWAK